jgi:hypothetical protein
LDQARHKRAILRAGFLFFVTGKSFDFAADYPDTCNQLGSSKRALLMKPSAHEIIERFNLLDVCFQRRIKWKRGITAVPIQFSAYLFATITCVPATPSGQGRRCG